MNNLISILLPFNYLSRISVSLNDKLNNFFLKFNIDYKFMNMDNLVKYFIIT
jgi:hypothetical protein